MVKHSTLGTFVTPGVTHSVLIAFINPDECKGNEWVTPDVTADTNIREFGTIILGPVKYEVDEHTSSLTE